MKKVIILFMSLLLLIPLSSCGKKQEKVEIVDDNYRNIYEIFVASFSDSDGDRKGDLNGVTKKLDYIQEMGYTGIWFMPIHRSPSYHKYDVVDYYSIDPDYGTMEDFEKLVEEAHKRDINIIIDLVINHTSHLNPWFIQALDAYSKGSFSQYLNWYNFSDSPQYGYAEKDGVYYEARFVDSMPDLNLDSREVRDEIINIMKFWIDKGVDGFRLDAVTSYYTNDINKNVEFLNWINKAAKSIKEDCYIVGEAWTSDIEVRQYYTSGIDSFFLFSLSQGEGLLAQTVKADKPIPQYKNALRNALSIANGYIPAIFLDNHDTNRITGAIGRTKTEDTKFAYGLAAMLNGTLFTYYGTEIGMVGSRKDENKRIAMLWDSDKMDELCKNPQGTTQEEYAYPGVKQQQKDKDSILNYHKQVNYLRNKYPEIARGEYEVANKLTTATFMAFEKTWEGKTICIAINFDKANSTTVDLSELQPYSNCESVSAINEKAELKGTALTIPAYTIAILSGE